MVASTLKNKSASKPAAGVPAHPPWSDMITECITMTPDGTRHGVSRPVIKKFVDSRYHLAMNAAATGQLNRAISYGTTIGNFVLPKGPSGKVKLAPKRAGEIAKENKRPKRPAVTETRRLPVSSKTKIPASFREEQPLKATRKYTSKAKKMRVTPFPGRQVPPRKATTQRSGAKRLTRSNVVARKSK